MKLGRRRLEAEGAEVGDARDHVAGTDQRPFVRQDPGDDAVAVRARGRQGELARQLVALLLDDREVEPAATQPLVARRAHRVDGAAELAHDQLRLLALNLGGEQLALRDQAVGREPRSLR